MKKLLSLTALFCLVGAGSALAGNGLPTTDKSGTITTGGTFQSITLPSGDISSIDFQNICSVSGNCTSTSNVCYIYFGSGTATTANATPLTAGQGYLRSAGSVPNDAIQVTCTGTGDHFKLYLQ